MLFDLIALAILAVFVLLGALRGTLAGFLRVATLFGAYAVGIGAAAKVGPVLALLLGTSRLMASAMAGTCAFLFVFVVGSVISALVIRGERARREDLPRSALDRVGGASFGALQATLALLLLGVLGGFLDAAHKAGLPQGAAGAADSYLVGSTQRVVGAGVSAAMGDAPGGALAAKMFSDPGTTLTATQDLLASPQFASLQQDALFWQYLSTGEVERALARPSFFAISHDEALRAKLADLGMVDESGRDDPEAFRSQIAATMTEVAPRLRAIREDPALAQLAAQPEIQRAVQDGDTLALLGNRDFRRFVDRALRDYERAAAASSN